MQEDEKTNFTAIWVFTPAQADDPEAYFKVYKQFDTVPNEVNAMGECPPEKPGENKEFTLDPPMGPYDTLAS